MILHYTTLDKMFEFKLKLPVLIFNPGSNW